MIRNWKGAARLLRSFTSTPGPVILDVRRQNQHTEYCQMPNHTSDEDRDFRRQLESLQWPPSEFNHRLHVRLAYIYLCDKTQEDAFHAMRDWTFRYLSHHEIDPAKYNETLTRAWMLAVRHFMARTPFSTSADDFIEKNPTILDSGIMMTHYSKCLLYSDKARRAFVEPDLDPIPRYPEKAA